MADYSSALPRATFTSNPAGVSEYRRLLEYETARPDSSLEHKQALVPTQGQSTSQDCDGRHKIVINMFASTRFADTREYFHFIPPCMI